MNDVVWHKRKTFAKCAARVILAYSGGSEASVRMNLWMNLLHDENLN